MFPVVSGGIGSLPACPACGPDTAFEEAWPDQERQVGFWPLMDRKRQIERSGLGLFFAHAEIVKEKDAAAYRALARERGFDPALSWMIGNSPKSDINPALEAGWNAVFVPHARTWTLERQEIEPPEGRLLVVERFADLKRHF